MMTYADVLQQVEDQRELTRFCEEFRKCIKNGEVESVRIFLESPYVNKLVNYTRHFTGVQTDGKFIGYDRPVLFDAIDCGHIAILRLLLEYGANAKAEDGWGVSALAYAKEYVAGDYYSTVEAVLKQYGAEECSEESEEYSE